MADSKSYKLGNAIEEEWNNDFDLLTQRSYKLKSECYSCDYFKDCQGGCMNEAIEQTEELFLVVPPEGRDHAEYSI